MPFDMVRIATPEGEWKYLNYVRIDAVIDESGADRTRYVLERGKKVGTPLPKVVSPPGPGLRVGPRSVTKAFRITETTVLSRVGGSHRSRRAMGGRFDFDLGGMSNVGEHTAVGATMFFGCAYDAKAGVRVRVRRWLRPTASIEIAPGITALEHPIGGPTTMPPGFSIQASLNPSRYISLTTEVFTIRRSENRYEDGRLTSIQYVRDTGVMVGGKVGQWPGAVVGVLPLFAFLFLSQGNSMQ